MPLPQIKRSRLALALLLVFALPLSLNAAGLIVQGQEAPVPVAPGADPWQVKQEELQSGDGTTGYYELLPSLQSQAVNSAELSFRAEDAIRFIRPSDVDSSESSIDGIDNPEQDLAVEITDEGGVIHPAGASAVYEIDVPEKGSWQLALTYRVPGSSIQELRIDVAVNGEIPFDEANDIGLPVAWESAEAEPRIDRYGNQTYPASRRIDEVFTASLKLDMFNLDEPLLFPLEAGTNEISISGGDLTFELLEITAFSLAPEPDYAEYLTRHAEHSSGPAELAEAELSILEGEGYSQKSHAHVRGERTQSIQYHPFDTSSTLINVLAHNMWANPGESVQYAVHAPKDGYYRIGVRYQQGSKHDMPVYKNIYIDGQVPFQELRSYAFPYTRNDIEVHWLGQNNEDFLFYLTAGDHDIKLESTASNYFHPYERLLRVIQEMNLITLDIKMITGSKVDENRDWTIEDYIPDIEDRLLALVDSLDLVYDALSRLAGQNQVSAWTDLRIIRDQIYRYTVNQDKDRGLDRLVNNLEVFSQGDGSLAEQLSISLQNMLTQPMAIDQLYVAGRSLEGLPQSPGFIESLVLNVRKLFASFTEYEEEGFSLEEDALNIWINRPVTYIDVLREMISQQYPNPDLKINLSAMPDENRLLLSVVAGEAPDGVLGISTPKPYDFALRGAAHDLRTFEDFGEHMGDFTAEMMVPFAHGEGIYALPETAIFFVLFYRTDILQRLGLDVPRTWDDLLEMLPDLDRQGMNVQTMIAATDAFKHFGTTVPFIQQFGGELYQQDGRAVQLDHPKTIEAFELLTDLYIRYNLPNRIQNFYNNFKSGLTPLGISDLNNYILLKNAAPEINGQWAISPNLGMFDSDGRFVNTQPDITSGVMILEQSDHKDEMWDFLKWWMSAETQLQYGNELQLRFGREYIWNTANLSALEAAPYFEPQDRQIIVEQVRTAREIPRHPAYFQVERELSNAWNTVVFDGTPVREALDRASLSSNRMINIKLAEFGYIDSQGQPLRPLILADAQRIESWGNFQSSERLPGDMGYGPRED